MKTLKIYAQIQEMAQADILSLIPSEQMERIKAIDSHPLFRVYSVGHEGQSNGKIVGIGEVVKDWGRRAIQEMAKKILPGTALFFRHNRDNSHQGRETLGEVVANTVQEIGNKINALVVSWIYPAKKSLAADLNTCSIEGNVGLEFDRQNGVKITDIGDITGIALGNSQDIPGFPGAGLVAALQCFVNQKNEEESKTMAFTLDDIKKAVQTEKINPSQLFTKEELEKDSEVNTLIKDARQGEYEHRRRVQKTLDDKIKEGEEERQKHIEELSKKHAEELKAKDEQLKAKDQEIAGLAQFKTEARKAAAAPKIKDLLEKVVTDEKARKFIAEKKLPGFEPPEDESKFDEAAKKFLEGAFAEYTDFRSYLLPETADEKKTGVNAPGREANTAADPNDFTDPANNDLIPGGK